MGAGKLRAQHINMGDIIKLAHVLADQIREAYQRIEHSHAQWIESTLELARLLAEARGQFKSNREFAHWLVDNDLDMIGSDDRAALINMASNLSLARIVLEETQRSSWQWIWREEMESRFRQVTKTPSTSITQPESREIAPENPETGDQPSHQSGKSISISALAKSKSSLARMHERAYLALIAATEPGKLRGVFNLYCDRAAHSKHRKLWLRYLDLLTDRLENGLKMSSAGTTLQIAWIAPEAGNHVRYGESDYRRFMDALQILWEPKAAAPAAMPALPVAIPIVQHPRGDQVVKINNRIIYPLDGAPWSLDDACVAADIVRTLWAECLIAPERPSPKDFAHIVHRNFVELRYATSFGGLVKAFQFISSVLDQFSEQERSMILHCEMPNRPVRYA